MPFFYVADLNIFPKITTASDEVAGGGGEDLGRETVGGRQVDAIINDHDYCVLALRPSWYEAGVSYSTMVGRHAGQAIAN